MLQINHSENNSQIKNISRHSQCHCNFSIIHSFYLEVSTMIKFSKYITYGFYLKLLFILLLLIEISIHNLLSYVIELLKLFLQF